MKIQNVVLPNREPHQRFDIEILQNRIQSVTQTSNNSPTPPSIVLPALCHPHIHLDKAYLLTSHPKPSNTNEYPNYSDLSLESGDFAEALSKTSQAKARYTIPDLVLRGSQLIAESIEAGVTSMRAFVEIDHVTRFKCIEAAIELKRKFHKLCHVQICIFAQDPIMSTEHGEENRQLIEEVLDKYRDHIEVLGTTPYVEKGQSKQNINWAIQKAIDKKLHLDFHLDYNVDPDTEATIWHVLERLNEQSWVEKAGVGKRIVCGHCTRMTRFNRKSMQKLAHEVGSLPVAFVGLPTSDLFMMGRPTEDNDEPSRRERGTLQVVDMIQEYGLQACIGINNVGNAFTPWGNADPLRLASLGVGLYQAGTAEHARTLYECVSTRARRAIGLQTQTEDIADSKSNNLDLSSLDTDGFLLVSNESSVQISEFAGSIPARQRLTITDIVWDPPEMRLRKVLHDNRSSHG